MKLKPLTAVAALVASACSIAEPLGLKGLHAGSKLDCRYLNEIETRTGTYFGRDTEDGCWSKTEGENKSNFVQISFLGKRTSSMVYVAYDGVIETIYLSADENDSDVWKGQFDYQQAVDAFEAKYGPADKSEDVVQNRFGAEFRRKIAFWGDEASTLEIAYNRSRVGVTSVMFSAKRDAPSPAVSSDI